jgi:hypothetical protein
VDRAVEVERFELAIVVEAILELEELNREPQNLGVVRQRGGFDFGSAPGDLLRFGITPQQLQVHECVLLDAGEASALALQALDLALGLADFAGVELTERR